MGEGEDDENRRRERWGWEFWRRNKGEVRNKNNLVLICSHIGFIKANITAQRESGGPAETDESPTLIIQINRHSSSFLYSVPYFFLFGFWFLKKAVINPVLLPSLNHRPSSQRSLIEDFYFAFLTFKPANWVNFRCRSQKTQFIVSKLHFFTNLTLTIIPWQSIHTFRTFAHLVKSYFIFHTNTK